MSRLTFVLSLFVAMFVGNRLSRADMLIASRGADEILRYDETTGDFLGVFASGGLLSQPMSMTVGPDGMLYVANLGRHAGIGGSVLRFDLGTGAFVDDFVPVDVLGGPATSVNFGQDGNLYVSAGYGRVNRYDGSSGAFIDVFASGISSVGGGRFGPDGNLYIASEAADNVYKLDATTGAGGLFLSGGPLDGAQDLAFGPDGDLYVTGYYSSNVLRYDSVTGAFKGIFATGGDLVGPTGIEFGPDGNLYVSVNGIFVGVNKIFRYNGVTGEFMDEFASGGGLEGPVDILFTSAHAVPEPASLTLLGLGALGLAFLRKRSLQPTS